MKTKPNLLAAGLFLAVFNTGFGQPVITTQPQNLTNVAGTTADFWVVATSTEPMVHQWQKLGSAWSNLAGCTATNLCLTNVQASHAADYRVVITNADGAVTSEVARLTVLVPPRITPTTSFQHQAIHLGQTDRLLSQLRARRRFLTNGCSTGPLCRGIAATV